MLLLKSRKYKLKLPLTKDKLRFSKTKKAEL